MDVTESTNGTFRRAFDAALRSLGDVNVVSQAEASAFILRVVVLCHPTDDCARVTSYFVALDVAQPLREGSVLLPVQVALHRHAVRLPPPVLEGISRDLSVNLSDYANARTLQVAEWGRDEYEQGIKNFVARFDHECLELARVTRRARAALEAHDSITAKTLWQEESRSLSGHEMC